MTLVDTSVWIDFFAARNTPQVAILESLIDEREDLCLCGVVLTEVLQGIRDEKEYSRTESALAGLIFLPMNRSTFLLAAETYRTLRSRGITIRNSVDCMIAAVCIENKAQLLHNDRDFDYIANTSDLLVISILTGDRG
ncbi:MAG: PIN domain nuclease [Syntrophobacteraceae bacterium]|nr:PIN domain nuclease [Syntrophobacteraceae bacterium]